jgi:hypothetical protein
MTEEGKDTNLGDNHRDDDESGQKMLYRYILDPTKERMPELTDLPLSQINLLTWMATYDAVFQEAVDCVKYAVELRRYKSAIKEGVKDAVPPEKPKPIMPTEEWRFWYYKHRRSLSGSGVKTAAVLAERQLEVQQEVMSPDQLATLPKD